MATKHKLQFDKRKSHKGASVNIFGMWTPKSGRRGRNLSHPLTSLLTKEETLEMRNQKGGPKQINEYIHIQVNTHMYIHMVFTRHWFEHCETSSTECVLEWFFFSFSLRFFLLFSFCV